MKPYNKSNIPLTHILRRDMTKWEKHLWYDFLKNYSVRFQRQKAIGEYIVDFYCAKASLAIELDGGYHNTEKQHSEDIKRMDALKLLGVEVIRFKNEELDTDFIRVCKQIDYVVQKRLDDINNAKTIKRAET